MTPAELKTFFVHDLGWGWSPQARLVFEFLCRVAQDCEGGVLLDAGAGRQRYRPFFAGCIYLTQEHPGGIEHKGMHDVSYDLVAPIDESIPLVDESLDGVFSTSVLEHVRYPSRFCAEAFRVLRPGARLYTHVPFTYPEHEVPYDFQRPTRFGLQRWLEDAGFVEVELTPTSSDIFAATAFLRYSVTNDTVRRRGLSRRTLRPRTPAEVGELLRGLPALASYLGLSALTGSLARLLTSVLDRGPHAGTDYPIGWLAVGRKPGSAPRRRPESKAQFLQEHRLTEML